MLTYIIKTSSNEYYCGRTTDIKRRIQEHRNEEYPHWFCTPARKTFTRLVFFPGDYEKKIKKFGSKNFLDIIDHIIKESRTP